MPKRWNRRVRRICKYLLPIILRRMCLSYVINYLIHPLRIWWGCMLSVGISYCDNPDNICVLHVTRVSKHQLGAFSTVVMCGCMSEIMPWSTGLLYHGFRENRDFVSTDIVKSMRWAHGSIRHGYCAGQPAGHVQNSRNMWESDVSPGQRRNFREDFFS